MKILLDESVPVQLRKSLVLHDVATVYEIGLRGFSNGDLLRLERALGKMGMRLIGVKLR